MSAFELYDTFMDGITHARKYNLQAEYIEWLFRDLKVNKDRLTKATRDALLNWDDESEDYIFQQQFEIPMIRVEA